MTDTEQQLWEKLAGAENMPYGRAQIATVEDVVRHADALELAELRYQARMLATQAYTFGGEPAKAFVTFAWCLAAHDRGESDPSDTHDLYWQFKWVAGAMTKFPEMSLERTNAVLDDMERRYRTAGHSLNPVHQRRATLAGHLGDVETAAEQYRLWCAAPRDELADCVGCEPAAKVEHLSWLGQHEEAVAIAAPVLSGSLTCVEQPQSILTSLLLPYLYTGRLDEAASAHRRAYRAIQANRANLGMIGTHLLFCARSGNHVRGLDLVERHLGWLAEPSTPRADLRFCAAAAAVLRQVAEAGYGDTLVRRPPVGDEPATRVPAAALGAELAERARALARRFDERNGTPAVGNEVDEILVAEPVVDHLPLSGTARGAHRPTGTAAAPAPASAALPDAPTELVELAKTHHRLGNETLVAAIWRRFDEVCPDPEPALLAARLLDHGTTLIDADPARAESTLLRAAELFERAGDQVSALTARGHLGLVWCEAGRLDDGLAEVMATTDETMRLGDDEARAVAELRLGHAHRMADQQEAALAAFARAAELAELAGVTVLVSQATASLAIASAELGPEHHGAALEHADRALAIAARLGPHTGLRRMQLFAGQLHAGAGDFAQAYELFTEAATADVVKVSGPAQHLRGRVALELDRGAEAYAALSAAVTLFDQAGLPSAYAKVDLGAAGLHTERPDDAAEVLEDALAELTSAGDEAEANRARFLLARAYRELGELDQALTLLDQAAEQCAREDNPGGVGQMRGLAGDILDELDRDALAAEQYTLAALAWRAAGEPAEELRNRRGAAVSWQWADQADQSLAALAEAETVAAGLDQADPGVAWERAMLAYDGARILAAADRLADALPRAEAAVVGFRVLDAETPGAFAAVLHGRLLADLGQLDQARAVLTVALGELPASSEPREQVEALLAELSS